jgi:hypothetical protein
MGAGRKRGRGERDRGFGRWMVEGAGDEGGGTFW